MFLRNTANQHIGFCLISTTTGQGVTGAGPLAWYSKDGSSPVLLGSGVVSDNGEGQYDYKPTQAETDCAELSVILTATDCVPMEKTVYPFDLTIPSLGVIVENNPGGPLAGLRPTLEVMTADGLLWTDGGAGLGVLRLQNAGPTQTGSVSTANQSFAGTKTFLDPVFSSSINARFGASDPASPTVQANVGVLSGAAYVGENTPATSEFCSLLFLQPSAGASLVALKGRQAGFGPTTPSYAVFDAAGVGHIGLWGSLADGTVVAGGLVITAGTGGSVPWSSITGTPTTLSGYGITSPLDLAEGGTGADLSATGAGVIVQATTGAALSSLGGTTTGDVLTWNGSAWVSAPPAGPTVASGVYTPTVTAISNVISSTPSQCQWMRVGNVVTVSGAVLIQGSLVSQTEFELTLPVASVLTDPANVAGAGVTDPHTSPEIVPVSIDGDTGAHGAIFDFNMAFPGVFYVITFTFTYLVLP
jgi:hypothetical protein